MNHSLKRTARRSSQLAIRFAALEPLEERAMFSNINVGDLNGLFATGESTVNASDKAVYQFTLTHDGRVAASIGTIGGTVDLTLFQEQRDAGGTVHDKVIASRTATPSGIGFSAQLPKVSLSAGDYFLSVAAHSDDALYAANLTADYAGESLARARDIGSATDATFNDFIGASGDASVNDQLDYYKLKMDARGQLNISAKVDDPAATASLEVIFDANGNGIEDANEALVGTTSLNLSQVSLNLNTGTYFVSVTRGAGTSNYHLHVNADYGGPTVGFARSMGSLDTIKTFNDFISASTDPIDDYSFSVTQTRPLCALISETGGNPVLALYTDPNNDGKPDQLITSVSGEGFASMLRTVNPGHYVLRVQKVSGGGTYSLSAETRPDQAGNTLATARNLGTINGLVHRDDYVSAADTDDFYKFTASANGTIGASLSFDFGDANLALIRDANNNGKIDQNEVIAATPATMNTTREFTHAITAGTYFLRVTHTNGTSDVKYFLSFQTDYAGSTPKTARNVGALAGTKVFNDWASEPFVGAVSDPSDLYKFTLGSTKTFSAQMIGTFPGQELDLQLYQDKNNDGVLSPGELIAKSIKPHTAAQAISKSLKAGTYFLRVAGINGETNYRLTMSA
jgi:hypothetical protein